LNIPYGRAPFIKTESQAIAAAEKVHGNHVKALVQEIAASRESNIPIFITGDFNEPSHLDWTAAAAKSGRHPIKVAYPTSAALIKAGFADAYRAVHPDEMKTPGYTWTPVTKISDPKDHHDRIDFIYFSGEGVQIRQAELVGENKQNADIVVDSYPSDHRAVVATISIPKQSAPQNVVSTEKRTTATLSKTR
jgi:exonuclease III